MTWARVGGDTLLRHNNDVFFPNDFWMQVDIWLPTQMGCGDPGFPGVGQTGYFIWSSGVQRGIAAGSNCSPTPCWRWSSGFHQAPSTGPTALTTYTVGFHIHPHTPFDGSLDVDYYVNGVLAFTDLGVGFVGAYNFFYLNYASPNSCCCNVVFFTNVKVGTSQGASDLFYDDFSEGNLDNWFPQAFEPGEPVLASVVDSPTDEPCPTVTITPTRGQPGDPITISGSGFNPGEPMSLSWRSRQGVNTLVSDFAATTDGAGNFSVATVVPNGLGNRFSGPAAMPLTLYDALNRAGCASFTLCGNENSDGIQAGWDNPTDQVPTNLPDPLVAIGGNVGTTGGSNDVLDYIFHDGAHWVLWEDPSAIENASVFNPIPTNHSLNATRISADGSSVVDYPMDTPYVWGFGGNTEAGDPGFAQTKQCCGSNHGAPIWDGYWCFTSWSKPIYDAHFASDGTTLWVGVVTKQTVPFPYLDNDDAHAFNPGAASQFIPLDALTSGFTSFSLSGGSSGAPGYHRYVSNTVGPIDFYQPQAYPTTDAGEEDSGHWSQPCLVMFAFSGSGFNQLGVIDALYCPGKSQGPNRARGAGNLIGAPGPYLQSSYRGSLFSRVGIAASDTSPGVCNVVWSEGGDWGRSGQAGVCCAKLMWDGGPQNRSYRVNYTTWSPTAKLTDQDIFESHMDRTNWHFVWNDCDYPQEFDYGYTWPTEDQFGALITFDLRCDNANGDVLLFAAPTTLVNLPTEDPSWDQAQCPSPDGSGHTFDDNNILYCDTLNVYDITGGTPVLVQSITPDLLPDEAECDWAYPLQNPGNNVAAGFPPLASDCLLAGPPPFNFDNGNSVANVEPVGRGFGISDIYEDPLLGGQPVYLVHVPWARRYPDIYHAGYGNYHMRAFYRVPADMSGPFEFLDGERQLQFTIIGGVYNISPDAFQNGDFFSDPDNLWMPSVFDSSSRQAGDAPGYWFDRVCVNQWQDLIGAETPSDFSDYPGVQVGYSMCHGFHWDQVADSVSFVSVLKYPYTDDPDKVFAVTTLYFCRGCETCTCGRGVHIAHRF